MPVLPKIARRSALLLATLAAAAGAEPSFVPVYKDNFPDPHIVVAGNQFVAYATNDGINLPMLVSRDLINWSPVADPANPGKRRDGMPTLAPWVKAGRTWAPEVMQFGKKWHLYYTANHAKRDGQCIGLAIADNPFGPFRDTSAEPMVCQYDLGGTIDASPFRDSGGQLYLYYKNDGNRVRKRTALWGQRMTPDGLSVIGQPIQLATDDKKWEMGVVEAPTMVRSPNGYVMFYSAGYYGWNAEDRLSPYSMGYATCKGPLGPCTDAKENPILHSFRDKEAGCISGPGHQSIFNVGSRTFVTFHAWAATAKCLKAEDERYMYVAPVIWKDGKPNLGVSLRAQ